MYTNYEYKRWAISQKGKTFIAHNYKGFFTGYHICKTLEDFLELIDTQYAGCNQ